MGEDHVLSPLYLVQVLARSQHAPEGANDKYVLRKHAAHTVHPQMARTLQRKAVLPGERPLRSVCVRPCLRGSQISENLCFSEFPISGLLTRWPCCDEGAL